MKTLISADDKPRIYAMRREGRTLDGIGQTFGVTRERVRQLCKLADAWPPKKLPKPHREPSAYRLRLAENRSLRAAGLRHCWICQQWMDIEKFSLKSLYVCRACSTTRTIAYYHAHREQINAKARRRRTGSTPREF